MIRKEYIVLLTVCLFSVQAVVVAAYAGTADGMGSVTFAKSPVVVSTIGDKITFSGTNMASKTTYLCFSTPDTITYPDQAGMPGADASTYQSVNVGTDNTWSLTWDTQDVSRPGSYAVYAYSSPDFTRHQVAGDYAMAEGYLQAPENFVMPPSINFQIDARLLVDYTADAGICGSDPDNESVVVAEWETDKGKGTNKGCLAGTEVSSPKYIRVHAYELRGNYPVRVSIVEDPFTSAAQTVLSGSDPTGAKPIDLYLDLTKPVVTTVPEDKTAVSSIPNVTISHSPARKGETVFINGTVPGNPSAGIALWIFGNQNTDIPLYTRRVIVQPDATGMFSYELDGTMTGTMPEGILYVVAQDPGKNNRFDVILDGDQVMNLQRPDFYDPSLRKQVMMINQTDDYPGPEPLRGSFAEDATVTLVDAINDVTVDDTATQASFVISGEASPKDEAMTSPDQGPHPALQYESNVTPSVTRKINAGSTTNTPRESPVGTEEILIALGLAGMVLRKR